MPANRIIDLASKLWITDLGLARLHEDVGVTCTGDLVGTLQYFSPERLRGGKERISLVTFTLSASPSMNCYR